MSTIGQQSAAPGVRPRWPYADAAQRPLLGASLLVFLGSFLPWVNTPFATLTGLSGPGLWTVYAGSLGVAGAMVRSRRAAMAQGLLMGAAAVGLPAWQLARILLLSAATGSWGRLAPGMGLVMVLGGGLWALRCVWRLRSQD